jgi:septum formation protein
MYKKIILASKSKVRKEILEKNNISCDVHPSNIDEDVVKASLEKQNASPEIVSKNLAELKSNKVSAKFPDSYVIGADSVIDLKGKVVSKPENRDEALKILKSLNGETHHLISSVCISRKGSMIWNYTDKAALTMKKMEDSELKEYLSKINDEALYSYNVYQIEGLGRSLFSKIEGNENTIMGIPVERIKEYLNRQND